MKQEDRVLTISPNGAAPPPFRVADRFRWECSENEGCEGFCIEARVNITNAERDALDEAHDAIVAYGKEWEAAPAGERDERDTPKRRELALIAPFVRSWNAVGVDAVTGEDRPIPAPADGGPAVFDLVEPTMSGWVIEAVLLGYLSGKGLNLSAERSRRLRAARSAASGADPS